jgi:cell division protein FtsW (lipid II flippase)
MTAVWSRRPNWRIAVGLCVVPGLGQLYNGQPRKALFFLLGTLLTLGPAIVLIMYGEDVGHALIVSGASAVFLLVAFISVLVFLVLFVTGLFLWASSATDARRTARARREGDLEAAARVSFFRL